MVKIWKRLRTQDSLNLKKEHCPGSYRPGKFNYFADSASRNPSSDPEPEDDTFEDDIQSEVSAMFVKKMSPITSVSWDLVKSATKDDEELQEIISQVIIGFPEENVKVSENVKRFWRFRDMLTVVDGVLLRGNAIVIPSKLRPVVLDVLGSAHQGVQAMRDRASDTIFWPKM